MNNPAHRYKDLLIPALFIAIPLIIIGIVFFIIAPSDSQEEPTQEVRVASVSVPVQIQKKVYPNISVSAEAVYVSELNTGEVLYAKNEKVVKPLASLTKVMTALVSAELVGDNQSVILQIPYASPDGLLTYTSQETWRSGDLRAITLIASMNNGAEALANAGNVILRAKGEQFDFVEEMNRRAKEIGLQTMIFRNPSGLDISSSLPGGSGTAEDIARLFEYIFKNHPEVFEPTKKSVLTASTLEGVSHKVYNTNEIIDSLPNVLASKTGYTDLSVGNLAVVVDPGLNNPVVVVVLGSTKEGRFVDVKKLIEELI